MSKIEIPELAKAFLYAGLLIGATVAMEKAAGYALKYVRERRP